MATTCSKNLPMFFLYIVVLSIFLMIYIGYKASQSPKETFFQPMMPMMPPQMAGGMPMMPPQMAGGMPMMPPNMPGGMPMMQQMMQQQMMQQMMKQMRR
jgi:hypothetical protein